MALPPTVKLTVSAAVVLPVRVKVKAPGCPDFFALLTVTVTRGNVESRIVTVAGFGEIVKFGSAVNVRTTVLFPWPWERLVAITGSVAVAELPPPGITTSAGKGL